MPAIKSPGRFQNEEERISWHQAFFFLFFHFLVASLMLVFFDLVFHLADYEEAQSLSFLHTLFKISANTNAVFQLLATIFAIVFSLFFSGFYLVCRQLIGQKFANHGMAISLAIFYLFVLAVYFQYWLKSIIEKFVPSGNSASRLITLVLVFLLVWHIIRKREIVVIKLKNAQIKFQKLIIVLFGASLVFFLAGFLQTVDTTNGTTRGEHPVLQKVFPGKPNIILFTFDGMRAANISFLGYTKKTTPFLDSLAANSIVFENAISTSIITKVSIPSLLYGVHFGLSYENGDNLMRESGKKMNSLPELLREAGYYTASYVATEIANPVLYELGPHFDIIERFGHYIGRTKQRPFDTKYLETDFGRWMNKYSSRLGGNFPYSALEWCFSILSNRIFHSLLFWSPAMIEWAEKELLGKYDGVHTDYYFYKNLPRFIRDLKEPFFAHIHGVLPHMDSRLPKGFQHFATKNQISSNVLVKELYDDYILLADSLFGKFFNEIRNTSAFENSKIILTSDHGILMSRGREAELHKRFGRAPFNKMSHVPLLLYPWNGPGSLRVHDLVSILDVAPTILEWAGVRVPVHYKGESLLPYSRMKRENGNRTKNRVVASVYGIRKKELKKENEYNIALFWKNWKFSFYNMNGVKARYLWSRTGAGQESDRLIEGQEGHETEFRYPEQDYAPSMANVEILMDAPQYPDFHYLNAVADKFLDSLRHR